MSKFIQLSQGLDAEVDDDDYAALRGVRWSATSVSRRRVMYAERQDPETGRKVRMHRVILGALPGDVVDHIDGNGLNNQKSNLRLVTTAQNLCNRGRNSNNTSGAKGVSLHRRSGLWHGEVWLQRRKYSAGYHKTVEDADKAVRALREKLHGEYANHGDAK